MEEQGLNRDAQHSVVVFVFRIKPTISPYSPSTITCQHKLIAAHESCTLNLSAEYSKEDQSYFCEDEYQDHRDKYPWLLEEASDASIAYDSDCVTCRKTSQSDAATGCQMNETTILCEKMPNADCESTHLYRE